MKPRLLVVLVSFLLLPLSIYVALHVQQYMSRASGIPANITVDVRQRLAPIHPAWAAFAQGGEEPPPMLTSAREAMKPLAPRYIRLDHIYDYYQIVKKDGDTIRYDFSLLDKTVDDIVSMGALPFFSLSYMPGVLTPSGTVIDPPSDWQQWKSLVQATVQHYSGKANRNLSGVYYEVWNEPELPQFGKWTMGGTKDYRLLYYHAAAGAAAVQQTNQFSLGGPAVGSYYPKWIQGFLSYVVQNKLRLDFYSWHRYHTSVSVFATDVEQTRQQLRQYPQFADLPLIISEWGIDSENSAKNGSDAAAAFTVATMARTHRNLAYAFQFEVKDGPPPHGGTWGILTHERASPPLAQKPRYHANMALSQLSGDEIAIMGEGTYVRGIASRSREAITLVLSNYDISGRNTERVPVRIVGLEPASYQLEYSYPVDGTRGNATVIPTNGVVSHAFVLPPNAVVVVRLAVGDSLATFISGRKEGSGDQALVLDGENPFVVSSPEFQLRPSGSIRLDLKFLSHDQERVPVTILEMPYASASGQVRLALIKQKNEEDIGLSWGLINGEEQSTIFVAFPQEQMGNWEHIAMGWDPSNIWLSVADGPRATRQLRMDARGGKTITFHPAGVALDNLEIVLGGQQVIRRSFDGTADQ